MIAIGGSEAETGKCDVLRAVVAHARSGPLAVLSAASKVPGRRWMSYSRAFSRLGVRELRHLRVRSRADAADPTMLALLDGAAVVFMTGGDQFRLLRRIAGTPVHERMLALHAAGSAIAGTSAGAAVCGELVIGWDAAAAGGAGAHAAVRGLGFLPGIIVEQHCAQRARVPRLASAVCGAGCAAVGVGLDEDTAVIHDGGARPRLRVVGNGNVYLVRSAGGGSDGQLALGLYPPPAAPTPARYTSHPVRDRLWVDVFAAGDEFDLRPGPLLRRRRWAAAAELPRAAS